MDILYVRTELHLAVNSSNLFPSAQYIAFQFGHPKTHLCTVLISTYQKRPLSWVGFPAMRLLLVGLNFGPSLLNRHVISEIETKDVCIKMRKQ
jgi:hypothetical protein